MIKVQGSCNNAKIFTDNVEDEALTQIKNLCDQDWAKDSVIRVMPDTHAGKGCTIGTTMTIKDKVCPDTVGVDVGCGMLCVNLGKIDVDFAKLDKVINDFVPSGMNIRDKALETAEKFFEDVKLFAQVDVERAKKSIGTLGGGNHFIEVDKDDEGNKYLVIHTGSRHMGFEVANWYMKRASKQQEKETIGEIIQKMKDEGREKEIESVIKGMKAKLKKSQQEYVFGNLFEQYINDMKVAQRFATLNRDEIAKVIVEKMEWKPVDSFCTIHNYIDTDNMILRKGAVSAKLGERLMIPINMRDGSLICVGKGNKDWNESAPHGAGRLCSRTEARKNFSLEEYKKQMEGIWSTSVVMETVDECPMAYKNKDEIVKNIEPTVDVLKEIVPVYNFKAKEQIVR